MFHKKEKCRFCLIDDDDDLLDASCCHAIFLFAQIFIYLQLQRMCLVVFVIIIIEMVWVSKCIRLFFLRFNYVLDCFCSEVFYYFLFRFILFFFLFFCFSLNNSLYIRLHSTRAFIYTASVKIVCIYMKLSLLLLCARHYNEHTHNTKYFLLFL